MNIFKEILKTFPEPEIEVVPDDPKDQEVANQMTQLIRHFLAATPSHLDLDDPTPIAFDPKENKWLSAKEIL